MTFKLGCAIWAYKNWIGDLYPPGSRAAELLSLYSHRLTAVEGNTTFYSVPDGATVARWAEQTPAGFEFCLKLPREITHQGALTPAIPQAIAFLRHMQGLGDRLGPLFAQLPPSYGPDQWADLTTFLQAWPHDQAPLAVEVRHPDWFTPSQADRLNTLLSQQGVGRVLLDTRPIYDCPDDPQLASERRKPQVPLHPVLTANFSLIRYISHPDLAQNQRFVEEWIPRLDQWLRQGTRLYLFIHCPVEERSPQIVRHWQHQLEQAGAPVPPLPWDQLTSPPTQLSLF